MFPSTQGKIISTPSRNTDMEKARNEESVSKIRDIQSMMGNIQDHFNTMKFQVAPGDNISDPNV